MPKFSSKIFIDGGIPEETKQARQLLGYLDGQTTNPSLIAKNLKSRLGNGHPVSLTQEMALEEYKRIVKEMSTIITHGSISIQVFANQETRADEMLSQARVRSTWIGNCSIKFPCTKAGLTAAAVACKEMPINITLVFSQSQAAAVYEATIGAEYPVFISPFVGRLDDRGECGMDVIASIKRLYKESDMHVETLTASVRNLEHIYYGLYLKSNIITIPFKVFQMWADLGFPAPEEKYTYDRNGLKPISYQPEVALGKPWESYDLSHELTTKGVTAFWNDWMGLFTV